MTYEKLLKIALGFRPALCVIFIIFAACQCSEKAYSFWPAELVPHIEIREPQYYEPVIKES